MEKKKSALPAVLLAPGNMEILMVASMYTHVDIEIYIVCQFSVLGSLSSAMPIFIVVRTE